MLRLMMITALAFVASSLPARADADVEVTLSSGLQAMESRIDSLEQDLEERFRKNTHYDRNVTTSTRKFASSHFRDVAWANMLLVPDLSDYGVRNLVSALVSESLNRAGIDSSGMIVRVHLDRMRVSKHSLARINGATTYVKGSIALVDAASGEIVRSARISANPIFYPTAAPSYQGPDYAFEETDTSHRMGPALAFFVMKGLEELYEGTEFPRPISLIYNP